MNIDSKLNEIRKSTLCQDSTIYMLKYIIVYIPEGLDIIQNPERIGYNDLLNNPLIQKLVYSGISPPINISRGFSFLL